MIPNCQICPVSSECQEAKRYMEYVHHETFNQCVLVSNINYMMDTYISVGLGAPKGHRLSTPDASIKRFSIPEVSIHLHTETKQPR